MLQLKAAHLFTLANLNAKVNKSVWSALILLLALGLSACSVGPDFVAPAPPSLVRYTSETYPLKTVVADGQSQQFDVHQLVAANWWQQFGSPALDRVVAQALKNNPTVMAAQASLANSQDNLQAGYGVFYPQIALGLGVSRSLNSPITQGSTLPGSIFNLFTVGSIVSYAIDLFGKDKRVVEALAAQVDYQRNLTRAAYLTLTANVVNTSIARAAYLAQVQATDELLKLEKEQLDVMQTLVRAGTETYSNALTLSALVSSNEASIPALRQKAIQASHLLATLQGKAPEEVADLNLDLLSIRLPAELPLSLPSDLVRQRPDILAAEAQLHAASAAIGVATAAMFPNISLGGNYSVNSASFTGLSSDNQQFWTTGVSATVPVFQGGALYYGRQAAIDTYQQAQQLYRQTVLSAFEQVANCLTALENDARSLASQRQARDSSVQALELIQVNYKSGLSSYLDVLVADVQAHQASIAYLQAVAQRQQDTVALFVALGGGWWNGTELSRPEISNKPSP